MYEILNFPKINSKITGNNMNKKQIIHMQIDYNSINSVLGLKLEIKEIKWL